MERVLRSVLQVGGQPEADDAYQNWLRLKEYGLEFPSSEDQAIHEYLEKFYLQMSAPPDFSLVREYFEKKDEIEVTARLEEVKKAQPYIRTNFIAIVRAEREQQQIKNLVLTCRDATAIAEHGRNLEKPVDGKKILRGVQDALGFLFDKMSSLTTFETGEKLEGVVSEDADELLDEYDIVSKTNKYAGRNLFGMEPVDSICEGHRSGEFWVHCAHPGELKCVNSSSVIWDHDARQRRTVREVFESGTLPIVTAIRDEGVGELRLLQAPSSHVVENGVQPVFRLTLSSGKRTVSTGNHRFLSLEGWKRVDELKPGDWIGTPASMAVNPSHLYTDDAVRLTGYMIGDGCIGTDKQIVMSYSEPDIVKDFDETVERLSPGSLRGQIFRGKALRGVRLETGPDSAVQSFFKYIGLLGVLGRDKFIPPDMFFLPENQVWILLSALWTTDGTGVAMESSRLDRPLSGQTSRRSDIKYYSKSERLCRDVQALLLRVGVRSIVRPHTGSLGGRKFPNWVVAVTTSHSKRKFLQNTKVLGRGNWSERMLANVPDVGDDTPFPTCLIPDDAVGVRPSNGARMRKQAFKGRKTVAKSVLEGFRADPRVERFLDSDLIWEEVRSVVPSGEEMTYDISVPDHHSFVVDEMVSHNTTLALNYAYNNAYVYDKNIFYAILEMPYKQLRRQLFTLHSSHGKFVTDWYEKDRRAGIEQPYLGLDYRKIRDGRLSDSDLARLKIVAQDFKATSKGRLFIWKPPDQVSIPDIHRKAEMFHNKFGCDGIVIDYLGMVKPRYRTSDALDRINGVVTDARMLALNFARGKGTPVLSLFQINRQGKMRADKADGRYDFAAIAYANQIEKDADVITYTYLNDQLRKDAKFYLGCMKNRDNPIFERMIGKILWQTKRMRAIESEILDINNDRLLSGQERMSRSTLLSTGDMIV